MGRGGSRPSQEPGWLPALILHLSVLQSGPPGPPGGPGMPPGGRGRGRGQGNWGPPGGEMTFSIPTHKCGLVIGRGE